MKTTLSFERLLRVLPPVLTVLLVVVCLVVGSRISWSNLLTYTPPNLLLAAVGILALYAVKSLSVVFPLSVLYIACALWFGRWGGLMMCYLGLTVSCTLPYLIGRRFGAGVVEHLIRKYPRLDKLYQAGSSNQVMLSYLLRIVTVLPGDFCSLFLGACSVSYPRYLLGSMLGLSPLMIVHGAAGGHGGAEPHRQLMGGADAAECWAGGYFDWGFDSLFGGAQPEVVLAVGARLRGRGHDSFFGAPPRGVYAGTAVPAPTMQALRPARVTELGFA